MLPWIDPSLDQPCVRPWIKPLDLDTVTSRSALGSEPCVKSWMKHWVSSPGIHSQYLSMSGMCTDPRSPLGTLMTLTLV